MKIVIETKNNGCTLKCKDYDMNLDEVYRFDEDNLTDLMCLLYTILELVHTPGGKYDKHRLEIRDVHGSAYSCLDKKCSICHK